MSLVVSAKGGTALGGRFDVTVKIRGEQTAGAMAVIEETIPAGAFISTHTHRNDVWVYVLSGEVGVMVDGVIESAGPGAWALKPRSVPHAMWNATGQDARIIEVLTPAGSERWFEEIAALEPGDEAGFAESCRRHGIEFLPGSPWNDEIRERFDL